jgi:hypothetical protein
MNQDLLTNGQTLLKHNTEHIFIIIEDDVENILKYHVYIFEPYGLIEYIPKQKCNLEEFYNALLEIGYERYEGTQYPVWFPTKYDTIYKLQISFPYDLKG